MQLCTEVKINGFYFFQFEDLKHSKILNQVRNP